jgi:predicted nucleotide-binding protein (sugar kinase/HSP70/actin superfamily)
MRIGIPRALLYYHYFPLWQSFWQHLGLKVVDSPPTDKRILDLGVDVAVPETCLPVKIYYGHVLALASAVDFLFVPRIVSAEKGTYICPKLMGLPDMIKQSGCSLPRLISPVLNARQRRTSWRRSHIKAALELGYANADAKSAWRHASNVLDSYWEKLRNMRTPLDILSQRLSGFPPPCGTVLLLLGHPYNIFDEFVSMDLIKQLYRRGYRVLTAEMLARETIEREARQLPKDLFWSLGRSLLGTALHCLKHRSVGGIIHVVSFGCGPGSLVGELLERRVQESDHTPFLLLTLDEHTGEGGVITRLEAFLDMIEWRNIS